MLYHRRSCCCFTFPTTIEFPICSSSLLITTSPLMALITSASVLEIIFASPLKRMSSCVKTVFMDSSYRTGKSRRARSTSNNGGIRDRMSSASSPRVVSQDFPPPPADRGCRLRAVSSSELVSDRAHDMFALACRPNTSGPSLYGRALMYSTKSSLDPTAGAKYVPLGLQCTRERDKTSQHDRS